MKPTFVFPIIVILLASTGIAFGQNRTSADPANSRQFLVSARAGGVNVADGDVTVKKDQADWQMVVVGDNLDAGQRLRTGPDSRAEILLNPGSYLRANENSELAFDSVALDDLKVRLIQGSVIVEATAVKGLDTSLLTVATADSSFDIRRAGIYRFSVSANGKAQAEVFKGRLTVDGTEVKDGKKVDIDGAAPLVSAFDSKDLDSFETWSKDRSKALIAANSTVMNPNVSPVSYSTYGYGLFGNSLYGGLWGDSYYSCAGWWGFDPFAGGFVYVPSAFYGCPYLGSPYGGQYTAYGSPLRHYRPVISPPPSQHHHGGNGARPGTPTIAARGMAKSARPSMRIGPSKGSNSLGIQRSGGFSGGGRVSGYSGGGFGRVGGGTVSSGRVSSGSASSGSARTSMPASSAGHSSGRGH